MKTINYSRTLEYYDGPVLIEARDDIGGHYLGMAVETTEGADAFVVVGVAPERLRQFRAGLVDLRDLVKEAGRQEWFFTNSHDFHKPLPLSPRQSPLAASEYLPEAGYFLNDIPADGDILQEAMERGNLVLELIAEPPEALDEHKIRLQTLVGLLDGVQKLVNHAYSAELRDIATAERPMVPKNEASVLDIVVPAAPGSFRIVLEAGNPPDLLQGNELARALHRLDVLFENPDDLDAAMEKARRNKGHLAGAYLKLLRFLSEQQTGLTYSWAEPRSSASSRRSISEAQARALSGALAEVSNLEVQEVQLTGEFMKVNRKTGEWGLQLGDKVVSGKLREDSPDLNGLIVGKSYRFDCEEEFQTTEGTGKEKRVLFLREFREA